MFTSPSAPQERVRDILEPLEDYPAILPPLVDLAREIARKLGPLGLTWSCNSRANLDYDTIKSFKDNGLRLLLVGYESGNDEILRRIKKGVTTERMRRFTRDCHRAGVVIHGTFILGLPVETRETVCAETPASRATSSMDGPVFRRPRPETVPMAVS